MDPVSIPGTGVVDVRGDTGEEDRLEGLWDLLEVDLVLF